MPKISEERKTERREQILAGARRCFARHGYEGATVVRLEEETGLSRGAIFNYFGSKEELFLELAWRDNERLVRLWLEKGWEAALREIAAEDPEWLGVYLEIARKLRTDPDFRREHETRTAEQLAGFIGLVANGVVVQLATGESIRNMDALVALVDSAVRDSDPARRPSRRRA